MLEIKKIRLNPDHYTTGLANRNIENATNTIQRLLDIDKERRDIMSREEQLKSESNKVAKSIGVLMREGKKEEAESAKSKTAVTKQQIKDLSAKLEHLEQEQEGILYSLPNIPHSSVPVGRSEDDNVVLSEHGEIPSLTEGAKPHWELAKTHDIIDFELGTKITGAGFPVYKGKGAKFLRALIQFFLDEADIAGYQEMVPPLLVNEDSGYGTGQLPDKEGQMYHVPGDNLYLIPTAEVPLTNLYRDEVVAVDQLPVKICGYTQCFRREAGSYGAHVRGLNRLHQFDKVEIVEIAHPDKSYERLEEMLKHVSGLLQKLGLPYRVLGLCSGDMGFTSAKTYDLEVYSAGQKRWLEVSSISNFETYQTNRLKLRYRDGKKNILAHTLNGSALALPRIMAAILENYQNEDGSINMPEALKPYLKFTQIG